MQPPQQHIIILPRPKRRGFCFCWLARRHINCSDILLPDKQKEKSYDELCNALKEHYSPKPLIIAERFKFYKREQKEGEAVAAYVIVLKQLSGRDWLVCGMRDANIQHRLLTTKELTFQFAKETAIAMELAQKSELSFRSVRCQYTVSSQ